MVPLTRSFQSSLLDIGAAPKPGPLAGTVTRSPLTDGAWIDLRAGWIEAADTLFEILLDSVPWRAEQRPMYDRIVDVPRLLSFYDGSAELPHPALDAAKADLDAYYHDELGEPFATTGLCLYRDGHDSVAWHGDTIGRGRTTDTMVAIVSLGTPRTLLLRPRRGGPARPYRVGHGDLLVMGGSCQRTWEHAVPKTARAIGPRISVQFRPRDVR